MKQHTMTYQSRTYTEIYLPEELPKRLTATLKDFNEKDFD